MNHTQTFHTARGLQGRVRVPGDKSLSHRIVMLGALGTRMIRVRGFLPATDCRATIGCMRALGAQIEEHSPTELSVRGNGLHGLRASNAPLDCGGSGTTIRLLTGLLA